MEQEVGKEIQADPRCSDTVGPSDDEDGLQSKNPIPLGWRKLAIHSPQGRIGHTLCTNEREDLVYLYGGVNDMTPNASQYLADFHLYDFNSKQWREVEMTGGTQSGRAFHTAVFASGRMHVFGGCNGRGRFNKLFSVNEGGVVEATTLTTPHIPATRYCHSAVVFDGCMYVYAGKCGGRNSNRRLNDLWRFDFQRNSWTECEQSGDAPQARSAHTAVTYSRRMIMFGGRSAEGECCDDLYSFAYDTGMWSKIDTRSSYFGRARHSFVVHNSTIVVFGGWNGKKKLNDLFYYHLDSNQCESVRSREEHNPSRRECHVAAMCKNVMVVFGGRHQLDFKEDTCELNLGPKSLKETCRDWLSTAGNVRIVNMPIRLEKYVLAWKEQSNPPPQLPLPSIRPH